MITGRFNLTPFAASSVINGLSCASRAEPPRGAQGLRTGGLRAPIPQARGLGPRAGSPGKEFAPLADPPPDTRVRRLPARGPGGPGARGGNCTHSGHQVTGGGDGAFHPSPPACPPPKSPTALAARATLGVEVAWGQVRTVQAAGQVRPQRATVLSAASSDFPENICPCCKWIRGQRAGLAGGICGFYY